jgi:predicted RNA-binding protein YlxR (DUF448 family)
VLVDESGKLPGRGAYLHAAKACWDEALKTNRIGQALRIRVSVENLLELREYAKGLTSDTAVSE